MLDQMRKKPFQEITIKELSNHADLDRRTFYRHFSSKEDILDFYLRGMKEEYIQRLSSEQDLTLYTVAKIYFELSRNHIEFLTILLNSEMSAYLLKKYNEYLPEIHGMFENEFANFEEETVEFALSFNAGGFWSILIKWIIDGAARTPEEMAHIVNRLMHKML